ncbi:MAG: hypothetical protein AVDCRST_MAG35-169, partial [uncultured Quadrisphaera sp.]
ERAGLRDDRRRGTARRRLRDPGRPAPARADRRIGLRGLGDRGSSAAHREGPDLHGADEAVRRPVPDPQPRGGVRAGPPHRLAALHRQPLALRAGPRPGRRDDGHRDLRPDEGEHPHRRGGHVGALPRAQPRGDHRHPGAAQGSGRGGRRRGL